MVKKSERGRKVMEVNRGAWTADEDLKLVNYVLAYGDKKWRTLPAKAGLCRCGKSCRLRWLNYLRPGIKRGNISEEEDDLIIRLHNLLGNRWSIIAGRLPGRTDNEIKNYWNTHLSKRLLTIDDLNNKLNHNPEANNVLQRSPAALKPSLGQVEASNTYEEGELADSWSGLSMPDFVSPETMPDLQHRGCSSSELGVEDYGIICNHSDYQDSFGDELCRINSQEGIDSWQFKSDASELDELEQFLGCHLEHGTPGLTL